MTPREKKSLDPLMKSLKIDHVFYADKIEWKSFEVNNYGLRLAINGQSYKFTEIGQVLSFLVEINAISNESAVLYRLQT